MVASIDSFLSVAFGPKVGGITRRHLKTQGGVQGMNPTFCQYCTHLRVYSSLMGARLRTEGLYCLSCVVL